MQKNKFHYLLILLAVIFMTSCQTFYDVMRVEPKPISDFLPNKEKLVKMNSRFPFHFVYLDKDAPAHRKIYIAPVDINYLMQDENVQDFIKKTDGEFLEELKELATYIRDINIKLFNEVKEPVWFSVVDEPNVKDSFSLELAIAAITPAKGGWNIAGTIIDQVIGGGTWITSQFANGSLTIEGRVRDNNTGKIVAMFATTEADESTIIVNVANFTWMSSAKTNAKNIAKYTARLFNEDDYENVKRDFPIQWISY